MLKKTKRNVFATLSFLFALSMATAGGVMAQNVVKAEEADASMLTMTDGGYIRLGWSEDENGGIVANGDTGIMFQATASTALATALKNDANATVGMMIVPEKALDMYEAQKETGESDYFKYLLSLTNNAATEDKIASTFSASQLSEEEATNLKVSIADLEDANYNQAYQAVAYYKTNGTYYYSAESVSRTVAEMADIALRTDNLSEQATQAAASVIEKAIELKNDGLALTVKTLATANLRDLFASYIKAEDLTFTVKEGTSASVDSGVVTALATSGETTVNVWAYDGAVDFDVTVTAKAEISASAQLQNRYTTYTTYGATVEKSGTSTFTGLAELNNVMLAAGTLESDKIDDVKSTNLSYIAFNRNDTNYNSINNNLTNYVSIIEFTGNNMPSIAYYVDNHSETSPMENIINQKGILITGGFGGFDLNWNRSTIDSFQSSLKIAGYTMMESDFGVKNAPTAEVPGSHIYGAKDFAGSYSVLQTASKTQRYRLFVALTPYVKTKATDNTPAEYATKCNIELYKINEDDTNGDLLYQYSANRGYIWDTDNFQGNIVYYGRPGESIKLDKVHLIYTYATFTNAAKKFAPAA